MKKILLLLLFTIASYGQAVFDEGIQITGNANSVTATKVNVQETDGKVNTKTINTAFNKNFGLNTGDVVGATTLLNQYSTTPVDWTATAFNSGQVVFYAGKQWIAKMATVAGDAPAVSSKWEEITFEALANKTVTVDQTIIDGSTNAVSGNAVFDGLALKSNIGHTHVASQITDLSKASVGLGNVDNTSDLSKPLSTATINALATKAPISSVHNPVTLGTANGLSLSTQQLSLGLASSGVTGALSGTDWNTFNNKQNTLTNPITGSLTTGYIPMASGTKSLSNSILRNSSGRLFNGTDDGVNTFQFTGSTRILSGNLNIDPNLALVWGATGATNFAQSYYNATSKKLIFTKSNGVNTLEIEDSSGNVNVPFNLSATTYTGGATLTGTPTAPTAPVGTNTNQIATTAFVQAAAAARPYKLYTFYVNQSGANIPTSVTLNNNTILPSTPTWERTGVGDYRFLIGTVNSTKVFPYAVQSSWTFGNDIYAASVQGQYIQITRRTNGVLTDGLINILFEIRQYP